jgi:hypothetical protein
MCFENEEDKCMKNNLAVGAKQPPQYLTPVTGQPKEENATREVLIERMPTRSTQRMYHAPLAFKSEQRSA